MLYEMMKVLVWLAMVNDPAKYDLNPCLLPQQQVPGITRTDALEVLRREHWNSCTLKVQPTPPPVIERPRPCDQPTCGRPLLPSWLRRVLP